MTVPRLAESAADLAHSGAVAVRDSAAAVGVARAGLVARGAFYLVLSYLAARIALLHNGSGGQADAHGALAIVSRTLVGKIAIGASALGFLGFGAVRLCAAWRDHELPLWRRATTALQGLFSLGLAYVPVSFLLGNHRAGTEGQQHADASRMLGFPGGRELVIAIGLIVVVASGWQIRNAVCGDYADGMRLVGEPRWLKRLVHVAGTVGIAARALVFLPVGFFLIVAGVQYDPAHADGLDGELLALSRHTWGDVVIALAAAGLVVFAVYSFLEARYRDVTLGK